MRSKDNEIEVEVKSKQSDIVTKTSGKFQFIFDANDTPQFNSNQRTIIELKCFLQKPTEGNLDILIHELELEGQPPKEVEYIKQENITGGAVTMEDLFNGCIT